MPSALGGGVSERVPPSGGEAGGALDFPGSVGLGEVLDLVVPARPGGDGTFNADQVEPEKLDEQEQKYTGPRKQGGDVAAGAQNADSRRGEGLGFIAFGSEARQKSGLAGEVGVGGVEEEKGVGAGVGAGSVVFE